MSESIWMLVSMTVALSIVLFVGIVAGARIGANVAIEQAKTEIRTWLDRTDWKIVGYEDRKDGTTLSVKIEMLNSKKETV